MSGPRDTRDSAEEAGTSAVPAPSVPPSFGGAVPPADPPPADEETSAGEAEPTASGSIRLPAFGLEAPWWAAESTETAPPAEDPPAQDPVSADAPADAAPAEGAEAAPEGAEAPAEAADEEIVFGTEDTATTAEDAGIPPGTLVAGVGVPKIDSRGAVPADPILRRPPESGDTDPDGFPAIRPDDAATETEQAPAPGTAEDEAAMDDTAVENAAEDRPAEDVPPAPEEAAQGSAFERAKAAENASAASFGQVLEPDAILPVGVAPPSASGPFPRSEAAEDTATTAEQAAVITPVYHAEGGVPLDSPPPPAQPPQGTPKGGGYSKRRPLLIGGGAAVILAAAVALFVIDGTGSDGDQGGATEAAESPAAAQSTPPPEPSPTPTGSPASIDNEGTDPKPLAFREVFPTKAIELGGRTYTRDRWSLNRDVSYAARGSMLQALEREKCRKIIRATFIHRPSSLAVTSGIAVMPTKDAALKVSKAGNAGDYEWFRGMDGKHTPNLDRAGGYAAATVRGRYVVYAYVQWANGKQARPGDPVIKQAARQFLDYDLRPIIARARN